LIGIPWPLLSFPTMSIVYCTIIVEVLYWLVLWTDFLRFLTTERRIGTKEVYRTPAPWPEETAPKHDPKRDQWIPTHQQSSSRTIILSVAAAPSIAHVPIGPRARCPFAIESRQNRIRNREIPVPYLHGCGFQRPSSVRFELDGGWQLTKVTQQIKLNPILGSHAFSK